MTDSSHMWSDLCVMIKQGKCGNLLWLLFQLVYIWLTLFGVFYESGVFFSLFQHNWVSRRADQGPKTIEQIHKEAKIEEQEEQRKVHQQLLSKDSKRRSGQACSLNPL